jgi:cyclophilin family peptidyl-prolyl cis-trans isomerase
MRAPIGLALLICALPVVAAAPPAPQVSDLKLAEGEELVAHVLVTLGKDSLGTISFRLYDKYAPHHVASFAKLAEDGFYDGTTFHRTRPGGFVQGGDPLSRDADPSNDGTGGPGYDLPLEINGKSFVRGTVGAANIGQRDNGSQFFICLKDYPEWDKHYTAIGAVISGIEVADKIAEGKRKGDHPVDKYVMTVHIEKRTKQVKLY